MERIFDLDSERILLKFQRVGGQIFCKTVEFLFSGAGESGGLHHHHHQPDGSGGVGGPVAVAATAAAAAAAPPTIAATALGVEVRKLSPEDVKVYLTFRVIQFSNSLNL